MVVVVIMMAVVVTAVAIMMVVIVMMMMGVVVMVVVIAVRTPISSCMRVVSTFEEDGHVGVGVEPGQVLPLQRRVDVGRDGLGTNAMQNGRSESYVCMHAWFAD